MTERIQKILSQQGYCSRRAADRLIEQGRVKINGRIASIGDRMDVASDVIAVDNQRVFTRRRVEKHYYMLNKPRGYVTTLHDRHAKKDVASLVEDIGVRLFPVGRLDKDSEGLLLMTNDGSFANMISHPSHGITKSYRVSVKPAADEQQLSELASGVELDGMLTVPVSVLVTAEDAEKTVFEMTLKEGKNREVRRLCEAVGLVVVRLKRTAIGPLRLAALPSGKYRELTKQELTALFAAGSKAGVKR